MKTFNVNTRNIKAPVKSNQRFIEDRYKVFALPPGLDCALIVDEDGIRFQAAGRDAGTYPHIEQAAKNYWDNSRFISGSGLTPDNIRAFKSGLFLQLRLIQARPASYTSFSQFADSIDEYSDNCQEMTQDQVSAVVMMAIPLSIAAAGKDVVDFQIRNNHVQMVLESLNMCNPVTAPYPMLRPMYEVRGNPFTGYGYGGPQHNDMTWRQALFAAQMYCGQSMPLAVNQYKGWCISDPTFWEFSPKVLDAYARNDYDV